MALTSSPVTKIHRSARLATRAASFRYGGRHHSGIPGGIIPLYPGDFVGIRITAHRGFCGHQTSAYFAGSCGFWELARLPIKPGRATFL